MTDLNDYDRPLMDDLYADVIDTLRENIKRTNTLAVAAFPTVGGTLGPINVQSDLAQLKLTRPSNAAASKVGVLQLGGDGRLQMQTTNDAGTTMVNGLAIG